LAIKHIKLCYLKHNCTKIYNNLKFKNLKPTKILYYVNWKNTVNEPYKNVKIIHIYRWLNGCQRFKFWIP